MPTLRSSTTLATDGSVNVNSSPQTISVPAGLATDDLLVVGVLFAQLLGTSGPTTPANMSRATDLGTSTNRLFCLYLAKVDDPADFASGITLTATSTTLTRVAAVAEAWTPDSGFEWDLTSVTSVGPEWLTTTSTSETYPSISAHDLILGMTASNKGASSYLTQHNAAGGGTNGVQALSTSAPSGSVSDSVLSLFRDGTGVSFVRTSDGTTALTQANSGTFSVGIDQLATTSNEYTATGTLTLSGSAEVDISLPTVTGNGFVSVAQMLETPGATWAHRNVGGTWPEMTEYGVRMAANHGHGVIEISCQRTSDGVWFGAHDQTPDRVAVQTTHDGTNFSSLTWAQVSAMTINVGSTGGPQPFATLEQLVETLPTNFIFLVDPKQSGDNATYRDEFLDLVDTLLGPTRAIIKLDAYANINTYIDAKARDYVVASYFYAAPSTPTGSTIVEARLPYTDLPGLNYNATQDGWDDFLDPAGAYYSLAVGKPMWGHVCASQVNADEATGKGATYIQSTSSTITPVGVEAWDGTYESTATGTLTLSGSATASVVYSRTAVGSLSLSGSAARTLQYSRTAAGALTLTGSAVPVTRYTRTALGSLALSGSAVALVAYTRTALGSLTLAGSADTSSAMARTAIGTLTLSGTAPRTLRYTRTGLGSLALAGSALSFARYSKTSIGELALAGSAAVLLSYTRTATGNLVLSGAGLLAGEDVLYLGDVAVTLYLGDNPLTLGF